MSKLVELEDYITDSIKHVKAQIETAEEQMELIKKGCLPEGKITTCEYVIKYEGFNLLILMMALEKLRGSR